MIDESESDLDEERDQADIDPNEDIITCSNVAIVRRSCIALGASRPRIILPGNRTIRK
jgi:hypothetical protein